jgi:hypothetical protein
VRKMKMIVTMKNLISRYPISVARISNSKRINKDKNEHSPRLQEARRMHSLNRNRRSNKLT